jgi:methyl-accepting chemotaxis protein
MKNWKVSFKLIISFMILVALMTGLTIFAVTQMKAIEGNYSVSIDGPLSVRESIRDFQVNFRDVRLSMLFIAANAGVDSEKCEEQYVSGVNSYESALISLKNAEDALKSNPKMSEEDKGPRLAKVSLIRDLVIRYRTELLEPMELLMRDNDQSRAIELINSASQLPAQIKENAAQMLQTSVDTSNQYILDAEKSSKLVITLMVVIAAGAAIVSIILALYISNLISKPLSILTGFMKRAGSTGDITLSEQDVRTIGECAKIRDEVGECISATAGFVNHIIEIIDTLEKLSDGDLTVKANILSDKDKIGISMEKTVKNLNGMFIEINESSRQVFNGSSQIADGAQSLASGSAEQAATLQEISASIQEIESKTKENAERTNSASALAERIMHNAETSNRQMEQMITAVDEINQANQNISKVIKAIDDIAFQTNILSLNAAVEAARAGSAGKGFAVVAEEVRNLATKSANSAKETGKLITNSMEKAQLGTRIAGETASSLLEIVTGIHESGKIIAEIARSSNEQTLAIEQINIAVSGITKVVQQNSATSEESAAASQEMSGQAEMLENLLTQFRLT